MEIKTQPMKTANLPFKFQPWNIPVPLCVIFPLLLHDSRPGPTLDGKPRNRAATITVGESPGTMDRK